MKLLKLLKRRINDFFLTKYKIVQIQNYYFIHTKEWYDPLWFPLSFYTIVLQEAYDHIDFMKEKVKIIDIVK